MPKPWPLVGRIRHGASPFVTVNATAYCRTCGDEVDVETQVGERDGVNIYRRRCLRCGRIVAHGLARQRLLSTTPLPPGTRAWIKARGPDRS